MRTPCLLMVLTACASDGVGELTTPCVPDVPAAFAAIDSEGVGLAYRDGEAFSGDDAWRYTLTEENGFGLDNHLQGVARLGQYLFVSGGDVSRAQADVFVVRMQTRPVDDAFANGDAADDAVDEVVGALPLEGAEWHAGGIDLIDGVLVVPTENTRESVGARNSSVRLFDVSDPTEPVVLPVVDRGEGSVSHAAGIGRLDDGYVLMVWDDRVLDFYRSTSTDLALGFAATPFATVADDEVAIETEQAGDSGVHGQSVSLVNQCDGGLYAVLNDNTSQMPVDGGIGFLDLYAIDIAADAVSVAKVASQTMDCPADQGCNFAAAGGVWVDPEGGLYAYSTAHYRDPDTHQTPFAEFAPR